MSDNEAGGKTGKTVVAWSDKERLVYLVALIEGSSAKLDYESAPRPAGRSLIACQRMIDRLKTTYKTDLEALKAGQPMSADGEAKTPKTPKTPKRKPKAPVDVEEDASPKKRGRPAKAKAASKQVEVNTEEAEDDGVKMETGDDDI